MRREGRDGMGVREGEERSGGRARKGRVNEYVYRKMSRQLSTTWSERVYLYRLS